MKFIFTFLTCVFAATYTGQAGVPITVFVFKFVEEGVEKTESLVMGDMSSAGGPLTGPILGPCVGNFLFSRQQLAAELSEDMKDGLEELTKDEVFMATKNLLESPVPYLYSDYHLQRTSLCLAYTIYMFSPNVQRHVEGVTLVSCCLLNTQEPVQDSTAPVEEVTEEIVSNPIVAQESAAILKTDLDQSDLGEKVPGGDGERNQTLFQRRKNKNKRKSLATPSKLEVTIKQKDMAVTSTTPLTALTGRITPLISTASATIMEFGAKLRDYGDEFFRAHLKGISNSVSGLFTPTAHLDETPKTKPCETTRPRNIVVAFGKGMIRGACTVLLLPFRILAYGLELLFGKTEALENPEEVPLAESIECVGKEEDGNDDEQSGSCEFRVSVEVTNYPGEESEGIEMDSIKEEDEGEEEDYIKDEGGERDSIEDAEMYSVEEESEREERDPIKEEEEGKERDSLEDEGRDSLADEEMNSIEEEDGILDEISG